MKGINFFHNRTYQDHGAETYQTEHMLSVTEDNTANGDAYSCRDFGT